MLEKQKKVTHLLSSIKENTEILIQDPKACDKQTYVIIFLMLGALCVETKNTTKEEIKEIHGLFERAAKLGDDKFGNANYILGKYSLKRCAYLINKTPSSQEEILKCFTRANKHFQVAYGRSQNSIGARIYKDFTQEYLTGRNIEQAYKHAASIVKDSKKYEDDYYLMKLRVYGFSINPINSEVEKSLEEFTTKLPNNYKKIKCHAYLGKILMEKFIKNSEFVRNIGRELTKKLKDILLMARHNLESGVRANVPGVWEYFLMAKSILRNDEIQDNAFCHELYNNIGMTGVVVNGEYVNKILEKTQTNVNARLEDDNIVEVKCGTTIYHYAPTLLLKAIKLCNYEAFEALIENGADPLEVMECKEAFSVHSDDSGDNLMNKVGNLIKDDTILSYLSSLIYAATSDFINTKEYGFLPLKCSYAFFKEDSRTKLVVYTNMRNLVLDHIKKTKLAILRNSRTGESFGCHLHWYIKHNLMANKMFWSILFDNILKNENDINVENSEGKTPLMLLCHNFLTKLYTGCFPNEDINEDINEDTWKKYIDSSSMPYYLMLTKLLKNRSDIDLEKRDSYGNTVMSMITNYPQHKCKESTESCKMRDEFYVKMKKCFTDMLVQAGANTTITYENSPRTEKNKALKSKKEEGEGGKVLKSKSENITMVPENITMVPENITMVPENITMVPENITMVEKNTEYKTEEGKVIKSILKSKKLEKSKKVTISVKNTEHEITINKIIESEGTLFSYFKGNLLAVSRREKHLKEAYIKLSHLIENKCFERDGILYKHPFPTHAENFEGISMKPMKGFTLSGVDLTGFNLSGAKDLNGGVFEGANYLKDTHGNTVITLSSIGYDNFKPSEENLRHVLANPSSESYEKLAFYALLHPNMLDTTHKSGFNALREAARSGDGYFVNIVLGTQPDILDSHALDESNGYTPLMSFISKAKEADNTCKAGIIGLFHYMQYAAYSGELYAKVRGSSKTRGNSKTNENLLVDALTKSTNILTAQPSNLLKVCKPDVASLFIKVTHEDEATSLLPLTLSRLTRTRI